MARYTCVECGAKAISKCVNRRHIVQCDLDTSASFQLLESVICLRDGKIGIREDLIDLLFDKEHKEYVSNKVLYFSVDELEAKSKRWGSLSDHEKIMLKCLHRWEIDEGSCIAGCCHKGTISEEKR